jgi:1-pyrroline-5-carboxylate dehydrogenase
VPDVDYASSTLDDDALAAAFEAALVSVRSQASPVEPQLIGGRPESSGDLLQRFDPCVPGARVGAAHLASDEQVDRAVAAARGAARGWRATPYRDRVRMLLDARAQVADQLVEISAVVSAETGKTRLEAIGETTEVLDMFTHYCGLMTDNDGYVAELAGGEGVRSYDVLVPYGVFAVISPFNFPVALSAGMAIAALVTGNTIVVKPSDKTPRSTAAIVRALHDHLPPGVVNCIHGGAAAGARLAEGDVDGIAFTGSAEVGWALTEIRGRDGRVRPVLAEMGGQNPAVVSRHADLDAAARGIVRSAFGLSGQKCSACRRVVVEAPVTKELTHKVVELARGLTLGDPLDPAVFLGPVIDDAIGERIDRALEVARRDGRVLTGGRASRDGNFFEPVVVGDLPPGHPLTRDELFAPFVTITAVPDFDAALVEANAVDYGLSAGVFTRDEAEVTRFLDEIQAGVVYVNQDSGATTGAWPGKQSFCGWKASGNAGKGGLGLWYLPGFMKEQSRTIVGQQ